MKRRVLDVVVVTMLVMLLSSSAHAQVPAAINYQGVLVDENGELTGFHDLEFNLHDALTGGTLIWGPQTFNGVLFVQGRFNVVLTIDTADPQRSIADAFDGSERYLGIKVDGGAEEISPRQRILSAPYAIRAETADSADEVKFSNYSTATPLGSANIYWSNSNPEREDIVIQNSNSALQRGGVSFVNWRSGTSLRISEGTALEVIDGQTVKIFATGGKLIRIGKRGDPGDHTNWEITAGTDGFLIGWIMRVEQNQGSYMHVDVRGKLDSAGNIEMSDSGDWHNVVMIGGGYYDDHGTPFQRDSFTMPTPKGTQWKIWIERFGTWWSEDWYVWWMPLGSTITKP